MPATLNFPIFHTEQNSAVPQFDVTMAYMESLSEPRQQSADWLLVCNDGKTLACHSMVLAPASKVLAGMGKALTPKVEEKARVPVDEDSAVAQAFLGWVYSNTVTFDASMAYRLAYLAHRLDPPGGLQILARALGIHCH